MCNYEENGGLFYEKIFLTLTVIMFVVSLFSLPVFAEQNDKSSTVKEQVIMQKEEIKDQDVLVERALKGISDDVDEEVLKKITPKANIKDAVTGKKIDLEVFATTQKLKVTIDSNGNTRNYYATTAYTRTDSGTNSGVDLRATSTIYYNVSPIRGVDCVTLTRATGYWNNEGSGITRQYGRVEAAVAGSSSETGVPVNQKHYDSWKTADSFDLTYTSSDFTPVVDSEPAVLVGIMMSCQWRHGTGTWYNFDFSNFYIVG